MHSKDGCSYTNTIMSLTISLTHSPTHSLSLSLFSLSLSRSLSLSNSGSMEPAFFRGDLLFLTNLDEPIRTGEIVVFKIKDRDIPIVHRVIKVHEEWVEELIIYYYTYLQWYNDLL